MTIQWFPGHMTKAKREMQENLKLVDLVIELRDCRIPLSSKNPMLDEIIQTKPRLIVLSKKDKGEAEITQQWIEKLKDDTTLVIAADLLHDSFVPKLTQACKEVMKEKIERMIRRGIRPRAIRAMVVGSAQCRQVHDDQPARRQEDRPDGRPAGVTRSLQWVKLNKDVELLDTPVCCGRNLKIRPSGSILR